MDDYGTPQIDAEIEPPRQTSPERAMLAAMLARAIMDSQSSDPPLAGEAREWLSSNSGDPYQFRWVCGHLDLDPEALRQALILKPIAHYLVINRTSAES